MGACERMPSDSSSYADVAELRRGEVATEEAIASREVDTTRLVRPASSERPRTGKRRRYDRRSPKLIASENDQKEASSDIESDSISDPVDIDDASADDEGGCKCRGLNLALRTWVLRRGPQGAAVATDSQKMETLQSFLAAGADLDHVCYNHLRAIG